MAQSTARPSTVKPSTIRIVQSDYLAALALSFRSFYWFCISR